MEYKTVLFDLDGTLTDPGMGITNSVGYALHKCGREVPERESLYAFIGPPLVDSFMRYYGFSHAEALCAVEYYREYFAETGIFENEVYPGIPALLGELKARGRRIILATSKPEVYAKRILSYFSLEPYFDFVAGATMDETRSHKADVIAYALAKSETEENAVMVGDRSYDILGAKRFSLGTIGVTYGYGSREELISAGADFVADDVKTLRNILIFGKQK